MGLISKIRTNFPSLNPPPTVHTCYWLSALSLPHWPHSSHSGQAFQHLAFCLVNTMLLSASRGRRRHTAGGKGLFLTGVLGDGLFFLRCSTDSLRGAICTGDPKCGCERTWGSSGLSCSHKPEHTEPFRTLQAWLRPSDRFSPTWPPGTWHLRQPGLT